MTIREYQLKNHHGMKTAVMVNRHDAVWFEYCCKKYGVEILAVSDAQEVNPVEETVKAFSEIERLPDERV